MIKKIDFMFIFKGVAEKITAYFFWAIRCDRLSC